MEWKILTARKISPHLFHLFNHDSHFLLALLELCFHLRKLRLEFNILIVSNDQRRIAYNRTEKLFLGDLLYIREAEF